MFRMESLRLLYAFSRRYGAETYLLKIVSSSTTTVRFFYDEMYIQSKTAVGSPCDSRYRKTIVQPRCDSRHRKTSARRTCESR